MFRYGTDGYPVLLQIPPRLFTIPEKQQLVPNLRAPESRNDLEALMRVVNDQICASMGVPASVVFEGVPRLFKLQRGDVVDHVCFVYRQVFVEFYEPASGVCDVIEHTNLCSCVV